MARILIGSALIISGLSVAFIACEPYRPKASTASDSAPPSAAAISDFGNSLTGIGRIEAAAALVSGQPSIISDPLVPQIAQAIQTTNCQVAYIKDPFHAGNRHSTMSIRGTTCPVSASYDANYQINQNGGSVSINSHFSIVDPQLQTLNDITDMSLAGNGQYNLISQPVTPPTDSGRIAIQLSGFALSKSKGKISLVLIQDQSFQFISGILSSTGVQKIQAKSSESNILLNAEIRIINGTDQSGYFMNSVRITAQEYRSYVRALGMILFN